MVVEFWLCLIEVVFGGDFLVVIVGFEEGCGVCLVEYCVCKE